MLKKLKLDFSSLLGLLLLALSIWAITQQLREYDYHDILNSLRAIPKSRLSWSIWLTAAGYLIMAGYDALGFTYLGCSIAFTKVAFTGLLSYVFSNTIGFALLTGSAIRYRFYSRWGVSPLAIAQVIAFTNFTFWLGLFSVAGLIFLINPPHVPPQLHLPFATVRPVGILFLLVVIVYLLGSFIIKQPLRIRSREFRFPSPKICVSQILISSFDWMIAAGIIYVLLPANTPLSYMEFLGIYSLAMFAGVISNVPGGLGVFETIVLVILAPKVSKAAVFGSLLAYRAVYDFLPLIVATGMLGVYELRHHRRVRG
ncbi:lysylphosphatidylglycerol synthase domain-containing protein [Aetokthonos hydrillicola Thurmond2011]|uniref:Lysylphosphatidylglycerol synthase domain-containing protein n=1 Tax=Aetokthonos hydrillicola Thurmond2011 TaxID=2712845 RepID=A0AAP5M8M4_9CYAN|nr:lysylphosphatidylglycerol synthase domain-containing protein [Aetokthonos hydrillicola]MBW4590075.1 flippase-like domain-containing protein [Aetokthonos hydrillicola CCALA 1050]MDR9894872.1 lysylphosphatidylglycerol synthase domain-containing protein [Aetokthonos hydrillicola Thurmond2011]